MRVYHAARHGEWSQLVAEIKNSHVHLVKTRCGEGAVAAGKGAGWRVVLVMVHVMCRDLREFRLES